MRLSFNMADPGRPTKFTKDTRDKIVQAIQMGATYELAAQFGGVSYDTFNNWMKRGAEGVEGDQAFVDFFETVKQAEGKAAVGWLAKIEVAANDGNWQAAAWKLERRYPGEYGRQRIELTGKDGGPVTVKAYQGFTPDEWDTDDSPAAS
jgi:hypothetical protein